jgi:hypothetical protein
MRERAINLKHHGGKPSVMATPSVGNICLI